MNRSVRTTAAVLGAEVLATPLAAGAMLATSAPDASAARAHGTVTIFANLPSGNSNIVIKVR
jgi:hypothetical protein